MTDFKLDFTATIISSDILEELKNGDLDDIAELKDKTGKLSEATDKLEDGAGSLKSGIDADETASGVDECLC